MIASKMPIASLAGISKSANSSPPSSTLQTPSTCTSSASALISSAASELGIGPVGEVDLGVGDPAVLGDLARPCGRVRAHDLVRGTVRSTARTGRSIACRTSGRRRPDRPVNTICPVNPARSSKPRSSSRSEASLLSEPLSENSLRNTPPAAVAEHDEADEEHHPGGEDAPAAAVARYGQCASAWGDLCSRVAVVVGLVSAATHGGADGTSPLASSPDVLPLTGVTLRIRIIHMSRRSET